MNKLSRFALLALASAALTACGIFGSRPASMIKFPGQTELPDTLRTLLAGAPIPCVDSTGTFDAAASPHCRTCAELNSSRMDLHKLDHARRLFESRFPTEAFQRCVRHGLETAYLGLPDSVDIRFEKLAYDFFASVSSRRAQARHEADEMIATRLSRGDSTTAARFIGIVGEAVWERAERLLSRATIEPVTFEQGKRVLLKPALVPLEQIEKDSRLLGESVIPLKVLPPRPTPSAAPGESEAEWARSLFTLAATLSTGNERLRARNTRLALATFVVQERWTSLDSAARAVQQRFPHDSSTAMAHALARFHAITDPVREFPVASVLFDTAIANLPADDAVDYRSFDHILSHTEELWRNQYEGADRNKLDARSWRVVDPLWLTAVNEMALVRSARMANVDFRFAHLVPAGKSGRDTDIGMVVIKRGLPEQRWRLSGLGPGFPIYRRSWSSALGFVLAMPGDDWHFASIYSDDLTLQRLIHLPSDDRSGCPSVARPTVFRCALYSNASWAEIPIMPFSDTIDVTVARFRANADSVDLYVSSRLPLRWFWTRNLPDAKPTDSIWYGLSVEDPFGTQFVQLVHRRALPTRELEWREQWMVRVPAVHMMHRVEAFLPSQQQMAVGSRLLTSNEESRFVVNGFGMSDVLIADALVARGAAPKSLRDLEVTPNGAVIAPGGSVALAWELYDLSADKDGVARWNVTLSREDGRFVQLGDVRSVIVGSPGANAQVQANEPGASLIKYSRSERAQPKVVEMLRFGMPNISPGRHVLVLRVEDLVSKRVTERSVSLRVMNPGEQARKDGWRYPSRIQRMN